MQKKIPMRQCVGCREMRPKRELVRVVKSPEGEITLDFKGKAPGRGAYVCPNVDCLKKARKAKALERGLRPDLGPAGCVAVYTDQRRQLHLAAPQSGVRLGCRRKSAVCV